MSSVTPMERTTTYETAHGPGLLVWRRGLLAAHFLPGGLLDVKQVDAQPDDPRAARLVSMLEEYFAGGRVRFDIDALPLDLSGNSPFALDVIRALADVPYGEVITYGGLAEAAGHPRASRAVGNVMAANPFPVIVPCHRVTRSGGGIGGFSGGMDWKRRLLRLERGRS